MHNIGYVVVAATCASHFSACLEACEEEKNGLLDGSANANLTIRTQRVIYSECGDVRFASLAQTPMQKPVSRRRRQLHNHCSQNIENLLLMMAFRTLTQFLVLLYISTRVVVANNGNGEGGIFGRSGSFGSSSESFVIGSRVPPKMPYDHDLDEIEDKKEKKSITKVQTVSRSNEADKKEHDKRHITFIGDTSEAAFFGR